MRARIGAAEDAFRGAGEPQRRRMWCRLRVQALPGRGAVHPGPPPLTLTACLLACAPARPPEREARESGPQEKHRGWFRDARITPLAGARVVRLRQGRPVLEHDSGSQLIEREAGTCGESELHGVLDEGAMARHARIAGRGAVSGAQNAGVEPVQGGARRKEIPGRTENAEPGGAY